MYNRSGYKVLVEPVTRMMRVDVGCSRLRLRPERRSNTKEIGQPPPNFGMRITLRVDDVT